jgi:hypothetical protein
MTNESKVMILFVFFIVPQKLALVSNAKRRRKKKAK